MSVTMPSETILYNITVPKTSKSLGSVKYPYFTGSNNSSEKENKKFPLKKVVVISALVAAAVGIVLKCDPARKRYTKEYGDIFINKNNEPGNFPMISKRDEVIVTEVANGNNAARKYFNTLDCDGESLLNYIEAERKVERTKEIYIKGCFDTYRTKHRTNEQEKKKFFRHIKGLKQKANNLHKKFLEPYMQSTKE